ncbi:MAG: nucleotidyl transferase AbiEii/AbiGii toxin family protein [Sulfuricaulis sp.]
MKDYFDLWIILNYSELDGCLLARAMAATFARRETALPENVPIGLIDGLLADNRKQNDWRAFLNKNKLSARPARQPEKVAFLKFHVLLVAKA